jgi:hypothetical protein
MPDRANHHQFPSEEPMKKLTLLLLVIILLTACQPAATPQPTVTPIPPAVPPPAPTPTSAPVEALTDSVNDILGVWWFPQAGAKLEYKADGTFRLFSSKETFDEGSYTFDAGKTTTVTSSVCKDQPATYEVYVTTQGGKPTQLRFQLVGSDPCDTRVNVLKNPAKFLNP